MKVSHEVKFAQLVKFDKGHWVVANEQGIVEADVNEYLREFARGVSSGNLRADHIALGAAITEPILQTLPYVRWTNGLYTVKTYTPNEDNLIPLESYVITAWESSPDGEAMLVRPGLGYTRPAFKRFETGIEIGWDQLEKAGWNILARMMRVALGELARKIDHFAQFTLDAAVDGQAGHGTVVAGGLMTKASVDAIIKSSNTAAFPMGGARINPGTLTDMSAWSGGPFFNAGLPPDKGNEIIERLYLGRYGGVGFEASPFVPTDFVYFAGGADMTGYEQVRGSGRTVSWVDERKGFDAHRVITPDYAFYVGNALNVRRLRIIA